MAVDHSPMVTYVLRLADDNMVLSQRLGELIASMPDLEEDIAVANIALDHLGLARNLYSYATELDLEKRSEDDFAMLRPEREFLNAVLVEQPNGDFSHTIVRQLFVDSYQVPLCEGLSASADERLAGIAAKAFKEARYHLERSAAWVITLGDGTNESHRRTQAAVDELWQFTADLFAADHVEDELVVRGVAPDPAELRLAFDSTVREVFGAAFLAIPADAYQRLGGAHRVPHVAPRAPVAGDAVALPLPSRSDLVTAMGATVLSVERLRSLVGEIFDPELPPLTLADFGILRSVQSQGDTVVVTVTPTYSGCPAVEFIEEEIRTVLGAAGCKEFRVERCLSPAWTSDWITADGHRKLVQAGIAPPRPVADGPVPVVLGRIAQSPVPCPRCGSTETVEISPFGSTACKALHRCEACAEPFDHFKAI